MQPLGGAGVLLMATLACSPAGVKSDRSISSAQLPGRPDLTPAEAARIPPMPPTELRIKADGNKPVLTWRPLTIDSIIGYRVYRKMRNGTRVRLADVVIPRFVDSKPVKGALSYGVTAISEGGVESDVAEIFIGKPPIKAPAKRQ